MSSKAMSLKARIRNYAKENRIAAQVVLQNYMFEEALNATAIHRGSAENIADREGIIGRISESSDLQNMWKKYQQRFAYAGKIAYADMIEALRKLLL